MKQFTLSTMSSLRNRIVVVKYGGAAMTSDSLKQSFAEEMAIMKKAGIRLVIVHGGGKEITAVADKLGIATTFIQGQRYTDAAMTEVVQMVLGGKINQDVVARLNTEGVSAVGVSGVDAGLLQVQRATGEVDLGLVGEIVNVNTLHLHTLLDAGFTPVIAPIGADQSGQEYNINADVAAAEIARALGAEKLFLLSDVDGVHADGARLASLTETEADELIATGVISNGMIPKMRSAFHALQCGVEAVHLVDGRVARSILRELSTGPTGGPARGTSYGTKLISQPHHAPQEMAG